MSNVLGPAATKTTFGLLDFFSWCDCLPVVGVFLTIISSLIGSLVGVALDPGALISGLSLPLMDFTLGSYLGYWNKGR